MTQELIVTPDTATAQRKADPMTAAHTTATHSGVQRERRKQRLTRLGSHVIFVGTFAILGGSLRGFNLLLVIAAIVVATMILQWRFVRRGIEAVSLSRRLPNWAFAGTPVRVRFQMRNLSQYVPLAMLRIEDRLMEHNTGQTCDAVCGTAVVSPGTTVSPHYECVFSRRGRYVFGPMSLSTSFPFGLIQSQLEVADKEVLYVYPALVQLNRSWQRELIHRHGGSAATARRSGSSEGDFFGLRDWQMGDNRRWIHWRTTARTEHPVVRQFEQQRRFDTCILVDAYQPSATASSGSQLSEASSAESEAVELAIRLAATIVTQLVGGTNRIVLAVAGTASDAVLGRGGGEGQHRMLRMLAELAPASQPVCAAAAVKAMRIVGYSQDLLVISSRSLNDAMLQQPEIVKTIQPWSRRARMHWINTSDPAIDRVVDLNVTRFGSDASKTATATSRE